MYVEPPALTELDHLTEVFEAQQAVQEAWLVGWLNRTMDGEERTDSVIAFVVDEPRGASDRHELIALIEELGPVASGLGLAIRRWAFVPPIAVEREIEACGVRIYPRE